LTFCDTPILHPVIKERMGGKPASAGRSFIERYQTREARVHPGLASIVRGRSSTESLPPQICATPSNWFHCCFQLTRGLSLIVVAQYGFAAETVDTAGDPPVTKPQSD